MGGLKMCPPNSYIETLNPSFEEKVVNKVIKLHNKVIRVALNLVSLKQGEMRMQTGTSGRQREDGRLQAEETGLRRRQLCGGRDLKTPTSCCLNMGLCYFATAA